MKNITEIEEKIKDYQVEQLNIKDDPTKNERFWENVAKISILRWVLE